MNAADVLPHAHAFVLDPDLKTSASAFATMAPGLEAQLREDVAAAWGVGNGDTVSPTAIAAADGAPAGVVVIRVHATVPAADADAGALAEHGDDNRGNPTIDVFEDLLAQYAISPETPTLADALSMAISHELVEYRNDSSCDRIATLPDGRVVAVEACDQVQEQPYRKLGVCVSNFNLPSNFGLTSGTILTNAPPFDFLGKQTAQFQCEPGGYQQVFDPETGWQMITAKENLVRFALDLLPMGMLRYRAELDHRGLGRRAKRRRRHKVKP